MGLQLELEKSLDENLKANQIGARRRRRGGAEESEIEAAKPAASYGLSVILKKAYDVLKPTASAVTQAAVAGAIIYATDQSFRSDLCDPLAKSLASTMSVVPMAAAYLSKCENAMTNYNLALSSTTLLVAPLLMNALKTAGSIFVPDETVDAVAAEMIEAAKNPGAAAAKAMTTRSKVKAEETKTKKGGKRKTKKRSTRSRKTRRLTFSY
jgi:hypothetical protein